MFRKIHFNCAGVGILPIRTAWDVIKFVLHFYFFGPRSTLLKYEQYIPMLTHEVAKLLNCSANEITYVKNTSEGVIIAAESLPLQAGDEILVLRCEYPANLIPWVKKRNDGLIVEVIDGVDSVTSYANLLRSISERTRVIAISWVQFSDGYMINLKELSMLCRSRGIFLVVDAVQIVGTRPIDLSEISVDFLICGGHKHLMSLIGSGFIYINQNVLPKLKPYKVGIRSVMRFSSGGFELKPNAGRFEDGTPNLIGIISLYSRIQCINRLGVDFIAQRTKKLTKYYKSQLSKNGIKFIDYPLQGNMISIPINEPTQLLNQFERAGVFVRVVENRYIRISYSYLNKEKDIHKFVMCFKKFRGSNSLSLTQSWKIETTKAS